MKRFIFTLIFSTIALAAMPTVEGLFRNSSNKELEGSLAVLELIIKNKKLKNLELESLDGVKEEYEIEKRLVKILFNIEKVNRTDVIFATYGADFSFSQMQDMKYIRNFHKTLEEDKIFDRRLFYSLINMYALNTSKDIDSIFKEISQNYKSNQDAINEDKKLLLEKYKKFLEEKKTYEEKLKASEVSEEGGLVDINEVPKSPLLPEEEEEKLKVTKIMNESMYSNTELLKLVKKGRGFFWELNMDNVNATFSNDNHNLKSLTLKMMDNEYKVIPRKHVVFGGSYQLPKSFVFENSKTQLEVEIKNFYTLESEKTLFQTRVETYQKKLKQNEKNKVTNTMEIVDEPSVLGTFIF